MKRLLLIVVLAAVLLAGCATEKRGTIDAPISHPSNNKPATIINMPDGYLNLAFKCHGPDGIYSHRRVAAPVIIPNDANCPQK